MGTHLYSLKSNLQKDHGSSQVIEDQKGVGQGAEAKPTPATMVPIQDWQQNPIQCQATTLEANQARSLISTYVFKSSIGQKFQHPHFSVYFSDSFLFYNGSTQIAQDQEGARQGAKAEPTTPAVVSIQDRQQDPVQRQATTLEANQARPLNQRMSSIRILHFS